MSDENSFDAFVRRNERQLWQALVPVAGPEAASDAVADALAYAWLHWERIGAMENPVGYLYTMAKRDALRPPRSPTFATPDVTVLADFEPRLLPALEELSEMQRQVVYLVEGFGWGLTDTARILGVSVSTVRNHLQRALDRLRVILKVETDV